MEEFAKLIFEQWKKEKDYDVDFFSDKGNELLNEAGKILNVEWVNKFYDLLCDNGEEIMERAFIAGFGYACKCLSNGKIEFNN